MRRILIAIAASLALAFSAAVVPTTAATVSAGAKCTVQGKYTIANNKTYQCVKSSSGLRWKLVSAVTKPGAKCFVRNAFAINGGWRRVQCVQYGTSYRVWVDKSYCSAVQSVEKAGGVNWVCAWRHNGADLDKYWAKSQLGTKCPADGVLSGTKLSDLPLQCRAGVWQRVGTNTAPWPRYPTPDAIPDPGWQVNIIDDDMQFSAAVVSVIDNASAEVCEYNGYNDGCIWGRPSYPDPANTFRYVKVTMVVHNWTAATASPYWWFGVVANGQVVEDRNHYTVTEVGKINDLVLLPGGEAVANAYVQVPNTVLFAGLIFTVNPGYPDYWTYFAVS